MFLKDYCGERGLWWDRASFPMKQMEKVLQAMCIPRAQPNQRDSIHSTPIRRVAFENSILIKFKPGPWLLNLFSQVPKIWPNVWKQISLL